MIFSLADNKRLKLRSANSKSLLFAVREIKSLPDLSIQGFHDRILINGKPLRRWHVTDIRLGLEELRGIGISHQLAIDAIGVLARRNTVAVNEHRDLFRESDHWETILSSLAGPETDMAACIALLSIPSERVTRSVESRIGYVMKRLGWEKSRRRILGRREFFYHR